jgi:hypothetical protein
MRRLAVGLVPDALKRRHERWSTARHLGVVRPATDEYVRRHGLEVRHGPFRGMQYVEGMVPAPDDLVAKLVGTYEAELHGVVAEWIERGFPHVVDVGSAEGYYAVGLAVAMPRTIVHAYDIDERARSRCAAMAERNRVAGRVRIGELCTASTLETLPEDGVALLSDCEGYERVLLDPDAAPRLRGWTMLVELHEFLDAGIAATIAERFRSSHDIELLAGASRAGGDVPELTFLDAPARARVLSERRPGPMRWAVLRPRDRS